MASLTKMMVAVVILQDHPLAAGADGPSVTITAKDVAEDSTDVSTDQSTVPVAVGEVLTERQLLEGLLIRSANNMAFTLANWDAGSVPAFVAKMDAGASQLGMAQTHYVDVSGFDARIRLDAGRQPEGGGRGLADPAFAAIVAMPHGDAPGRGHRPQHRDPGRVQRDRRGEVRHHQRLGALPGAGDEPDRGRADDPGDRGGDRPAAVGTERVPQRCPGGRGVDCRRRSARWSMSRWRVPATR